MTAFRSILLGTTAFRYSPLAGHMSALSHVPPPAPEPRTHAPVHDGILMIDPAHALSASLMTSATTSLVVGEAA